MFQPIFYIQLYEMKHEDYIDKINSLTTAVNQFKESYSLLKFSLEASEKRNESLAVSSNPSSRYHLYLY